MSRPEKTAEGDKILRKCIECGKEIKANSESIYCEKCDEALDKKFEQIEDNILIYKELMDSEIAILNKFEKEDIADLYLRAFEVFKENGGFTEEEARVLGLMRDTFHLTEKDVGKDKIIEFNEKIQVKKLDKSKCPDCSRDIKEDFNLCPYCGYKLKI